MRLYIVGWILLMVLLSPFAFAQNEYLNSGGNHCSSHRLEPYMEYNFKNNFMIIQVVTTVEVIVAE